MAPNDNGRYMLTSLPYPTLPLMILLLGAKVATSGSATNLAAGVGENTPTFEAGPAPKLSDLTEDEITSLFVDFVTKFEKTYSDEDEASMRREIFRRNLKRIDEVRREVYLI